MMGDCFAARLWPFWKICGGALTVKLGPICAGKLTAVNKVRHICHSALINVHIRSKIVISPWTLSRFP